VQPYRLLKITRFCSDYIDQPTASAPTQPSRQAANVKSIFSAVYTDVAGSDYFPIGINKIGLLLI
jgi:hypothetical protein